MAAIYKQYVVRAGDIKPKAVISVNDFLNYTGSHLLVKSVKHLKDEQGVKFVCETTDIEICELIFHDKNRLVALIIK